MKQRKNQRNDKGITLVALIITIIILVILAAVSISAVYNSKIVDYAVNGATGYAGEAVKENEIMSGTESLLDSTVKKIEDILGGKTPPEEESKYKIGAYVNYTPDTPENATYTTTQDGTERSGNGEQTITRDTSLKWRIMNAEGNKLILVSETIPSGTLALKGADGYNNGVKLLNEACNSLYKNSNLGATGRSVNVDDINSLMGVTEETKKNINSSYGQEFIPSNKWYPSIFKDENTGYVDSTYGTKFGLSDQSSWYSGSTTTSTLKGKWTYYSYTFSDYKATSTVQHALATGQTENSDATSNTKYWLASRSVWSSDTHAYFQVFYATNASLAAKGLFHSAKIPSSSTVDSYALRPCIEIDLTKVNIGETGTGDSTSPYSISLR